MRVRHINQTRTINATLKLKLESTYVRTIELILKDAADFLNMGCRIVERPTWALKDAALSA